MEKVFESYKEVVAACIIRISDSKMLMVKRDSHGSMPDVWVFAGGTVEDGETHINAVRREVQEELGLDLEFKGDPFTFWIDKYNPVRLTTFVARTDNVDIVLEKEALDGYAWVSHEEGQYLKKSPMLELNWDKFKIAGEFQMRK